MKVAFDTNILLRLLVADDDRQVQLAIRVLANADQIMIPMVVLCEAVWVMRTHYRVPTRHIADRIESFIADDRVTCDMRGATAGLSLLRGGGDFADAVISAEERRLGADSLVTFDRKAAKLLQAAGESVTLLD